MKRSILKVTGDFNVGEATVKPTQALDDAYPLLKADLLRDVLSEVQDLYDEALEEMCIDWETQRGKS